MQAHADHDLIDQFASFYRDYYHEEIGQLAQRYPNDQSSLTVDWMDLWRFDPDLADRVREHPDQTIEYMEDALAAYDIPLDIDLDATVRLEGLDETHTLGVAETRAQHVNEYIQVDGQVTKRSKVKPRPTMLAYQCQRCERVIEIPQAGTERQDPHECPSCERQGPFEIDLGQSNLIDHQLVRVREPPEQTSGGQGKHIDVVLEGDAVNTVTPGDRVDIAGTLRAEDGDGDEIVLDTYLDGRAPQVEETDFEDIDVSQHADEIEAIAAGEYGPPIEALVESLAPKIRGYEDEKLALILQLFGGNRVEYPDGSMDRGDSHILLLGDPGCGKSSLLRAVETIAPRSAYISGKGVSKAGLLAAAVRDDFGTTEWGLEAGAMVKADKGVACVDEIDKVDDDAVSALHDALESQRVEINKAGINTSLPSRTALAAAGNPKYGRFDRFEPIADQIDLGPTLLSRFDLMFMLKDSPDAEEDADLAEHMIDARRKATEYTHHNADADDLETITPTIPRDVMRAYIAYAKQNVYPTITDEAAAKIKEWFTQLRQANENEENSDGQNPVPVTARKVEAMERLAEASARARLSETVETEDIERVKHLVMRTMRDVGIDHDEGKFDADVVETGTSKSQRDRIRTVKNIIQEIEDEYDTGAPHEVVISRAQEAGLDRDKTEREIEKLSQKGELYEPESDTYRTT